MPHIEWPYFPTVTRLALALALGLFVGLERERRGKETGLRTFGLAALIGATGGMLGAIYSYLSIMLLALLVVFLNVQSLKENRGTELTTSAAFLLTGIAGILCGQGHTLTPTAIAIVIAALLAWKRSLSNFTLGLTEPELRSAILLAILAFVIYPALPTGTIDKWGVIEPRTAWITVIIIAGLGFVNYILWKLYGKRGIKLASFLGGLVNSSVTVNNIVEQVREAEGGMNDTAYQSIILAASAMILRNAILLAILAPQLLFASLLSFVMMMVGSGCFILTYNIRHKKTVETGMPVLKLQSPFSLWSALQFGLFFLALQVISVIAQQLIGQSGTLAVSFFGGLFSSASSIAATAAIFHKEAITGNIASISVIAATLASIIINLPIVARTREKSLIRKLALAVGIIMILGVSGITIQTYLL